MHRIIWHSVLVTTKVVILTSFIAHWSAPEAGRRNVWSLLGAAKFCRVVEITSALAMWLDWQILSVIVPYQNRLVASADRSYDVTLWRCGSLSLPLESLACLFEIYVEIDTFPICIIHQLTTNTPHPPYSLEHYFRAKRSIKSDRSKTCMVYKRR